MRILVFAFVLAGACAPAARAEGPDDALRQRLDALEQAIAGDPENLPRAADYRQIIISCGQYDRSTRLFETLAKRKGSGPNIHISRALAYVDKVPVTGRIRHLYLGRDAINALTRAIEQQPSPLAYYVRGRINLFYNNAIFRRAHLGVADLQQALALTRVETPRALVERVWVVLGDGYWRTENAAKARETWAAGAARFPESADLKLRVGGTDEQVALIVRRALNEDTRVDTSLRELIAER